MEFKNPSIVCSKCKTRVHMNELKSDIAGKSWICDSCYIYEHPNLRKEEHKPNQRPPDSEKRFKYQCTKCKYNFFRNKEFSGACPYCGEFDCVQLLKDQYEKAIKI